MTAAARRPRRPAGPSGADLVAAVAKKAAAGWPAGVTLLTGTDLYHLDRAQKVLLDALVPEADREFGLTVFGDERVPVATAVSAARSVGMFAERRVVLVRDAALLEGEPDALLEFGAKPPSEGYLLLRAPALDLRRKLHKALESAGTALRFDPPGDDPRAWVRALQSVARDKRLALDPDAAMLLAQVCGADLYRVDSELEKIALLLGGGAGDGGAADAGRVGVEIVRESIAGSGLMSGWEVADAVLARDRRKALAAARRLAESDEPIRVVGGLAYRARTMIQGKALLESGMSPGDVVQAVRAWAYRDAFLDGLRRYSIDELLRFPGLLFRADRTLKSRQIDRGAVLEDLVDRLTSPAAAGAESPQ